jgi:hypothetical protein
LKQLLFLAVLLFVSLAGCSVEAPLPEPDDELVIAEEHSLRFGDDLVGEFRTDGFIGYRITASEGAWASVVVAGRHLGCADGVCGERCEDHYETQPILLLRGPLEGGVFSHRTMRLADARDYSRCDLDAQIALVLPERGTYQVLAIDMEERQGSFAISLDCYSSECVAACELGCPEGSLCAGGICEPMTRGDAPVGL